MIYLYYGENAYLIQQKLAALKERFQVKFSSGLNFWKLDLEENFDDLPSIVESRSMFAEKKLIFLRGIFSINEESWDKVKKILANRSLASENDIFLIFYDFITPMSESYPKKENVSAPIRKRIDFLKQVAKVEEFKSFSKLQLINWASCEAKNLNLQIKKPELEYLIDNIGQDIWRLANELKKLTLFSGGNLITKPDIDNLVSFDVTSDIFKTIEALARKDVVVALTNLEKHWQKNEDPLMVLSMIIWQFRSIIRLADLGSESVEAIARKLKIKPWLINKNRNNLKRFTLSELKKTYQRLADADMFIKTGLKDGRDALRDFVYSFL